MIGQTLGHYRIDAKLGEGGMGVVYRAFDTHLDRAVAIKVLRPDATASPDRRRRFVQEAKSASALNHPGIVHIYDIDSANLPVVPPQPVSDSRAVISCVEWARRHGRGCHLILSGVMATSTRAR
jgi:serine/threonine protein kinase